VMFSEVRRTKRPIGRSGKQTAAAWGEPAGAETQRLCTVRYTSMYQAVATRNGSTTGESLVHWNAAEPNFGSTAFSRKFAGPGWGV
jgi:hypothetical protein